MVSHLYGSSIYHNGQSIRYIIIRVCFCITLFLMSQKNCQDDVSKLFSFASANLTNCDVGDIVHWSTKPWTWNICGCCSSHRLRWSQPTFDLLIAHFASDDDEKNCLLFVACSYSVKMRGMCTKRHDSLSHYLLKEQYAWTHCAKIDPDSSKLMLRCFFLKREHFFSRCLSSGSKRLI